MAERIVWVDRGATDIQTVIKGLGDLLIKAFILTLATVGAIAPTQMMEYLLAMGLNVGSLVVAFTPIEGILGIGGLFGGTEWFAFTITEWNVVVVTWLVVGFLFYDIIVAGIQMLMGDEPDYDIPEPTWASLFSYLTVPALVGWIAGMALGNTSLQFIGKVWLLVVYNITLIPSILFDGQMYAGFGMTEYLVVAGGFVVTALVVTGIQWFLGMSMTIRTVTGTVR